MYLARPQVVIRKVQERQPDADEERDLADHDLISLLAHLAESRGESHELVARPVLFWPGSASSAGDVLTRSLDQPVMFEGAAKCYNSGNILVWNGPAAAT